MKPASFRLLILSTALAASAIAVHAHPGHEGDELTWDFGHLAQHPGATLGFVAVFGVLLWAGARFASLLAGSRDQSLRGSQASRGK